MRNFDSVILGFIFISYPLLLFLIYVAHNKNLEKKENDLFFGLAIFSSAYLLVKYTDMLTGIAPTLLLVIPLIIAYIKNKKIEAIVLSFIMIFFIHSITTINTFLIIIECIVYFLIYFLRNKNIVKMNDYIFGIIILTLKSGFNIIFLSITNAEFDLLYYILASVLAYIILMVLLVLIKRGDDILKYHMTYKELEKEKQIKQSLFQITHEIKNPLAVCKGYLDMLDINKKEQCEKYIPIIKEEINRTLLLLQDFLCINKIKLNNDILDVTLLLEESLENIKEIAKENNIEIIYKDEDEIYLNADYNRLVQVIINIIKNSIEAIEKGKKGYIEISTEIIKDYVCIHFNDNGIGIKEEDMEKIKEPFFTTKSKGAGLGISLSYQIIEAHKGEIIYKSEYGKGTTVTIKLPYTKE